jgi:hypothetical protein
MGSQDTYHTEVFALLAQTLSEMKASSPQQPTHHSVIKDKQLSWGQK